MVVKGEVVKLRFHCNKPAEPDTWFSMFSTTVAWSCSRTKYIVPNSDKVSEDKIAKKYLQRCKVNDHLNFLEWLHIVNHTKTTPKPYTQGTTLVGTKMYWIFSSEYFFQYTLSNFSHRSIEETFHHNHAQAIHHFPNLWNNYENNYENKVLSHLVGLQW